VKAVARNAVRVLLIGVAIAVMIVLPSYVSDFHSRDLAQAGVFFIAIVGLNIVTGYAGQISLGHGALMAIGGYTTANLVAHHGLRDVWTIPLAGLLTGVIGLLVGLPALRLSGLYLALATFGLSVAMPSILKHFSGVTGGDLGLRLVEEAPDKITGLSGTVTIWGYTLTQNHFLYYLTWSIALVLLVAAWALLRSGTGRAFRAIRDSELAAESFGVNRALYKTLAFGISGFYAGVAGSLLVVSAEIVNPLSFTFLLSITLLVGTVVGGLGSLSGMIVGAFFLEYLPDLSDRVSRAPGVASIVYGAVIILVMIALPGGAGGALKRFSEPLTTRLYTRSQ
jgi:branched-chain amino acid transport system permease protein